MSKRAAEPWLPYGRWPRRRRLRIPLDAHERGQRNLCHSERQAVRAELRAAGLL